MKFSVLMSIYYKEKAEYFNRAMESIWNEQTVKPNEIVLVQDGSLTDELYESINKWQEALEDVLQIVPLEKNVGLGDALNIGLDKCNYEFVARMDTDDISLNNRFEKQLKILKNSDIDICSSWVSEFDDNEQTIVSYRKLPQNHNKIIKYAKNRCPINHPAVMYKKSSVFNAGGYQKMMWFEDYYLWIRMILQGSQFYNIQEPLVNMRAGYGQLERRSGFKYAISEFNLQKEFLNLKFITKLEFIRNTLLRFTIRLMPKMIIKLIYKILRR